MPVVEMQAHRRIGMDQLWDELVLASSAAPPASASPFPAEFCDEVAGLKAAWDERSGGDAPRYLVERWLLDSSGYIERADFLKCDDYLSQAVLAARAAIGGGGTSGPGGGDAESIRVGGRNSGGRVCSKPIASRWR